MTEPTKGLLDTSVVIDHDVIDSALLPAESAISAVTLAELSAGPHATQDTDERARRQDRLQWAISTWDPLPFDAEAARAYGNVRSRSNRRTDKSCSPRRFTHCVHRGGKQLTALHAKPFRL